MTFRLNIYSIVLACLVSSFLLLNFSGLLHFETMMQSGDNMPHCPFAPGEALCTMDIFGHINAWRGVFVSLPKSVGSPDLLILAIILATVIGLWRNFLFKFFEYSATQWKFYIKQHPQIRLFNSLQEAFSRGILNPKIYNSAII